MRPSLLLVSKFWNCAEIIITSDGSPPTPPSTTSAPTYQKNPPTINSLPPTPLAPPTVANMCGLSWFEASSKCSTPCPTGNATVCPSGEYCYAEVNIDSCLTPSLIYQKNPPTVKSPSPTPAPTLPAPKTTSSDPTHSWYKL